MRSKKRMFQNPPSRGERKACSDPENRKKYPRLVPKKNLWSSAPLARLAEAPLVDQLSHGLQGGEAVGDVGLHELQHVQDGLVHLKLHGCMPLGP